MEITTVEQNKENRMKRIEESLRDLWDNTNIRIIGVPEEEREKGPKKIFEEILAENFHNMGKKTVQVQEAQDPRQYKSRKENAKTHSNQMHCPGRGKLGSKRRARVASPESFAWHLVTKWLPEGDGWSLQAGRHQAPQAAVAARANGLSRGPGRHPRVGRMKCRAEV